MKTKEVQVMQGRARLLLDEIAGWMFLHGPNQQHFKGTHQSQQWAGRHGQIRDVLVSRFGVDGALMADRLQATTMTMYSILATIARDQAVKEEDLDILTKMSDTDAGPLRYVPPNPQASAAFTLPYRRLSPITGARSPEGVMADLLLEYMQISSLYGRVHWICQRKGCGAFMTGGRGGKKFCSPACRKAHWQDDQQKQLLNGRKKKARQYTKGKKKAAKGVTHGKTKTAKRG